MSGKLKLKSYSNGELILNEEYQGKAERKGRYLRYEYKDESGNDTHMVVCFDDAGLYRLDSGGERTLEIRCQDGKGRAVLGIGAHFLEGAVASFRSSIAQKDGGVYRTEIVYMLYFEKGHGTKTRLIIEATDEKSNNGQ